MRHTYTTQSQRCLGIDPGIGNTGWAVVAKSKQGKYTLIESGVSQTSAKFSTGARLAAHEACFYGVLDKHLIDFISIEAVYFNKNITSCLKTAKVIGIAEVVADHAEIACVEVQPQLVKSAVGIPNSSNKTVMLQRVNKILNAELENHHEADATACAIAGFLKFLKGETHEKTQTPSDKTKYH